VTGVGNNSAESVLAQIDRILASSHFARSQTLSRFPPFIVELTLDGKANELKLSVGSEVNSMTL
jgi:hypothetical protein